jgi:uncharacterized protein YceH (UPF0502 family)
VFPAFAQRLVTCTDHLDVETQICRLSQNEDVCLAETVCYQVGQRVVGKYGKQLTKKVASAGIGKRPLDCWAIVAKQLALDASAQELVDQSEVELQQRCANRNALANTFNASK